MNQTKDIIKYKSKFLNRLFNIRSLRSCRLYFNCLFFNLFVFDSVLNKFLFFLRRDTSEEEERSTSETASGGW